MGYPGPWQEGLSHVQNIDPDNAVTWEPAPYSHPYSFPGRFQFGFSSGNGVSATGPAGSIDGWDGGAAECAWEHCRRGSAPGLIYHPPCPDPNLTAGENYADLVGNADVAVENSYQPPVSISVTESNRWRQFFVDGNVKVFNKYTTELNARRNNWIAPPSNEWPEGAIDVEFDTSDWELDLEKIEIDGYGWTQYADTLLQRTPELYARAIHPEVGANGRWWPRLPEARALPETIVDWNGDGGQGAFIPGEAWTVDERLFPFITQDGNQVDDRYLSLIVILPDIKLPGNPFDPTVSGHIGGQVSRPSVRMHFRSARWRYLYSTPQPVVRVVREAPPLRRIQREDGRGLSSAPRLTGSRSRQGSLRISRGYL